MMLLPTIEGYALHQKLGEGGFGVVYKGADKRSGQIPVFRP